MGDGIHYGEKNAIHELCLMISEGVKDLQNRELVILCIGTDRSSGDSLGPIIGTKLKRKNLRNFHVYGTLEHPVHALNQKEVVKEIKDTFKNPYIIAIDACLGRLESVGKISYKEGSILPGKAMKKNLPSVGDAHITGVVNVGGGVNFLVIQGTRLFVVAGMAEVIARGIHRTDIVLSRERVSSSAV